MTKNILQQNRVPRFQLRGQQAKRRNHWKIDIVLDRHELWRRIFIQSCNRVVIAGIDFFNLRVFLNNLRFVVAHLVDLMRDLIEI